MKKYYLLIKKQIREQAKFIYSPLGKAFKEQIKIKDLGRQINFHDLIFHFKGKYNSPINFIGRIHL